MESAFKLGINGRVLKRRYRKQTYMLRWRNYGLSIVDGAIQVTACSLTLEVERLASKQEIGWFHLETGAFQWYRPVPPTAHLYHQGERTVQVSVRERLFQQEFTDEGVPRAVEIITLFLAKDFSELIMESLL